MRKERKKQIENYINLLPSINETIIKTIHTNIQQTFHLIADSYDGILLVQKKVIESEGEEHIAVTELKKYRQQIELLYEALSQENLDEAEIVCKKLMYLWDELNIAISQIPEKLEVVFMPYKATMWDSLESVWMAADADQNCDAYVVPIPYYERNVDHSLGTYHYEADLMPKEVPITHYEDYDLEERRPDIIYIHNPYDWANNVTSVDPRYYSDQLKKYTECLVYIPYYSTSGGMAEAQEKCLAYYNVDYIVIQSEKYRKFFDANLPDEKFLPFGSPKFDRVIRICQNPPKAPIDWQEKMQGKKVYFYNTSLGGMLADTERFFKKMQYVFACFGGRENVCLLWRPHPLFESTIDSMRASYKPIYNQLKNDFLKNNLGIYDTTPDITNTIALCDAYIGDAGTSVTSLFGVVGKPMFILNNNIHSLPQEDDWRGEIIRGFCAYYGDDWRVTQGNKLYYSEKSDYDYHYVCDLYDYAGGGYFHSFALPIDNKQYVCPANAQEIVVIQDKKIIERIQLKKEGEQTGVFYGAVPMDEYLYLIPNKYPAIVRYHTRTKKLEYIKGYNDIFVKWIAEQGEWRFGPVWWWKHYLLIASPTDSKVLAINNRTGKVTLLSTGVSHTCGCCTMVSDGQDIWMLPYTGTVITRWNPDTGARKEYTSFPANFICKNRPHGYICEDRPLAGIAFWKNYVYFTPMWGNMFLRLDKKTSKIEEWKFPIPIPKKEKNGYYGWWHSGAFDWKPDSLETGIYHYFSVYDAKLYEINLETEEYHEIPVKYDKKELEAHVAGFCDESDWLKYCCMEDAFNSLSDFLEDNIKGAVFDREKQIHSYQEINASCDGDCGEKVHMAVKNKLSQINNA